MRNYVMGVLFLYFLIGPTVSQATQSPTFITLASEVQVTDHSTSQEALELEYMPPNYFLLVLFTLGGFAMCWFIFYKIVYPFLLKYYHPDYCKKLFWSLVSLYGFSWLSFSIYVIFEIGFYYSWLKWVFVFTGAMWLIWFIVIILKKNPDPIS